MSDYIIELDGDEFIATIPNVGFLYGCGKTSKEALDMLKREAKSMHKDIKEYGDLPLGFKKAEETLNRLVNKWDLDEAKHK